MVYGVTENHCESMTMHVTTLAKTPIHIKCGFIGVISCLIIKKICGFIKFSYLERWFWLRGAARGICFAVSRLRYAQSTGFSLRGFTTCKSNRESHLPFVSRITERAQTLGQGWQNLIDLYSSGFPLDERLNHL
jgi:hypothetical protein